MVTFMQSSFSVSQFNLARAIGNPPDLALRNRPRATAIAVSSNPVLHAAGEHMPSLREFMRRWQGLAEITAGYALVAGIFLLARFVLA
jgi:hypothetical protein